MQCPRCGEEMYGGVCDNCGFPITKMRKREKVSIKRYLWYNIYT